MSDIGIALATVLGLFVMILGGVPVGFSLIAMSMLGMVLLTGGVDLPLSLLGTTSFAAVRNYVFVVVPLFILMGAFMTNSRVAAHLYAGAHLFVRKITGGLGIATVFANTVFSAATGVSVASAAIFSTIALPEMERHGYQKRLALGTIAGSSVLGMLIPPSLLMILYGLLTGVSIGALFVGGIVPGILLAALYCLSIYLRVKRTPSLVDDPAMRRPVPAGGAGPEPPSTLESERAVKVAPGASSAISPADVERALDGRAGMTLARSVPVMGLVALVIGGIWGGIFSPTEASAIGAFGALVVGLFSGLSGRGVLASLKDTAVSVGAIMLLLVSAQLYSRMLSLSGASTWVADLLTDAFTSTLVIVLVFVGVLIVLGMVLDSSSIIMLAVPLMFPVILTAGIDPLWFGIVMIVAVEVGMLTPPFGMVPFAMSAVLGNRASAEDVFVGAFPFVVVMLFFLLLLVVFPPLSTWLPGIL